MKTKQYINLIVFVASSLLQQAFAQKQASPQTPTPFQTGSWQMGVKEGYTQGNLLKNRNSLQVHGSYFLVKQLAVGIAASWSREWVGDFGYTDLSVGPYARYQFTKTRLSPFLEASYQFGKRRANEVSGMSYASLAIQSTQLTPGISISLLKPLRLDLSYRFEWVDLSTNIQAFGLPQVGLTYLLR
ncbi:MULTISPECIES: hypothetical protein [unclassified Spirosoma]|uniref:hypothetical protein n=1 Tax=unclassified Spirosoma TaxID=2621999 RepID=UPI00096665DF|nr:MULTISPECIES: hypothetical protein [unclassified Spirosoma]MBN8822836.1 hypothetical protein [Spirosoma sp.]OJW80033.1 MAG: hypothetical protein BGO59_02155 [Spirosoma sp. 48-14]